MSAAPPAFRDRLRDELVAAAHRDRRRARRRLVVGAGAITGLVFLATVAVVVLPDEQVGAGTVDVDLDGPDVVVRIVDLEADPGAVRRDLAEAGVDEVRVEEVPVAPEQEGRFVTLAAPPEVLTVLDEAFADDDGDTYTAFRVPRGLSEPIEVFLGRAAAPGEPWATTPSAFRPGGPLACRPLVGRTVEDVARAVESGAARVRWLADDQGPTARDAVPGHLVYGAVQTADDTITVFVAPDLGTVTPMDDLPPGCDDPDEAGG